MPGKRAIACVRPDKALFYSIQAEMALKWR
jgi:hypothetical protein